MKALIAIVFLLLGSIGFAQEMRIGLLRDYKVKRVNFSYHTGVYSITADGVSAGSMGSQGIAEVELKSGKLSLKVDGILKGIFAKIVFTPSGGGVLKVTSKSPIVRQRKYQGAFEVKVVSGRMTIVNKVSMQNYLAGVIESEGGGGRHIEYYKVQALMSRTYAMKNKHRHKKEGFHLCDGVHCQAYHNMLRFTPEIRTAVKETKGEVIVDGRDRMVTTYFSANCGGQTCDASYVWNTSVPYIETFRDTFCIHTKQATWTKRIPQVQWKNFLVKQYGYPIGDSVMKSRIYSFEQPQRRAFYIHPSLGIPLRDLRRKFKLKSTFFNARPDGTDVLLEGRGFGHGVGLCQEGAMRMARLGYTYKQIALYYFTNVRIIRR